MLGDDDDNVNSSTAMTLCAKQLNGSCHACVRACWCSMAQCARVSESACGGGGSENQYVVVVELFVLFISYLQCAAASAAAAAT